MTLSPKAPTPPRTPAGLTKLEELLDKYHKTARDRVFQISGKGGNQFLLFAEDATYIFPLRTIRLAIKYGWLVDLPNWEAGLPKAAKKDDVISVLTTAGDYDAHRDREVVDRHEIRATGSTVLPRTG